MTSFEYIRRGCGNKEWGGRIIYHNYKLCFQPLKFEQADDGRWYYSDHIEEVDLKIVARGIVPHYIRYEHEKDLKELFADYYNGCLDTFKNNRRNDIELMLKSEKEIEIVFVETMIDEESWRIDFSKKGLKQYAEYFTDEENEILRQVCNGFIGYLQDRLKELKPKQKKTKEGNKPSHDYFKYTNKQDKACRVFKNLKGQYIDDSTPINDWLLACGFQSNDKNPFKPIKWLAQLNELVYMIDMLFPSCRWRWKAAEHCFTIDGNPPDNGAMRTESSAPTITTEKIYKLDKILEIN